MHQNKQSKNHVLIPALIAAIAAYFGFKKKSETLASVAKDLVTRAVDDQTRENHAIFHRSRRKHRRGRKRNFRDRYYE